MTTTIGYCRLSANKADIPICYLIKRSNNKYSVVIGKSNKTTTHCTYNFILEEEVANCFPSIFYANFAKTLFACLYLPTNEIAETIWQSKSIYGTTYNNNRCVFGYKTLDKQLKQTQLKQIELDKEQLALLEITNNLLIIWGKKQKIKPGSCLIVADIIVDSIALILKSVFQDQFTVISITEYKKRMTNNI